MDVSAWLTSSTHFGQIKGRMARSANIVLSDVTAFFDYSFTALQIQLYWSALQKQRSSKIMLLRSSLQNKCPPKTAS